MLRTADIVEALWDGEAPATAPTIVHAHVRRLRDALGEGVVVHDGEGYRLDLPADAVDLWVVDDAARSGDHRRVRSLWNEPVFGPFRERPWARVALAGMGHLAGVAAEAGPPSGRSPRRSAPVGRLVGRRGDLVAVTRALTRSRLVSIVGLGGVGKSRLALEVAVTFPDATHVDLGASVGPVATRIAGDLGLVATGEPEWDQRTVASTIGRREALLVLDGCEHASDDVALIVGGLLAACPRLRVLATSRVALGHPGEAVVPLLPFPDPGSPDGDAVELLTDRLVALGVEVHARDRRRLSTVCARTAGVPLAIELAAVETIFGSDAGPGAVPEGAVDPPPAPARVVHDAVRQALTRLTPATSRAVQRLVHLPHGVTPGVLARLVGPDESAPAVLHELRATGLVTAMTVGGSGRLGPPDAVRTVLSERPDRRALRDVTAALCAIGVAVRADLAGPIDPVALGVAVAELANVDAVLAEVGDDRVSALILATATAETWGEAGHWTRGGVVLAGLLGEVRPDDPSLSVPGTDDPRVVVDPLVWAAAVRARATATATYVSVHDDRVALTHAIDIAAREDASALEAHLVFRHVLGIGYGGDLARARRGLERLRVLGGLLESDLVAAMADHVEALGMLVTGEHERAADALRRVADRLVAQGAGSDAARSLRVAGLAGRAAGLDDATLADLRAAEALAVEAGAAGTLATIRGDIVEVHRARGRLERHVVVEALDSVLAVGNLRAAGLLGMQLGAIDLDVAVVANAALDLLAADRVWASLAIAELVDLLPARHPLTRAAPRFLAELRSQWGSPLDPAARERVDTLAGDLRGDPQRSDAVLAELVGMLGAITRDGSGDTRAAGPVSDIP